MNGKEILVSKTYVVYAPEVDGGREIKLAEFDTLEDAEGFCRYHYACNPYIALREVTLTRINSTKPQGER